MPVFNPGQSGVSIGTSITSGTSGSVLFIDANGKLAQDNANFFWDDGNNRLGIGTALPGTSLDVVGQTSLGLNYTSIGANIRGQLQFNADSGSIAGLSFVDTAVGGHTWTIGSISAAGNFQIRDLTAVGAPIEFSIDSTGKVGIGTVAPGGALDVMSTGSNNLRLSYDATHYSGLSVDSAGVLTISSKAANSNSPAIIIKPDTTTPTSNRWLSIQTAAGFEAFAFGLWDGNYTGQLSMFAPTGQGSGSMINFSANGGTVTGFFQLDSAGNMVFRQAQGGMYFDFFSTLNFRDSGFNTILHAEATLAYSNVKFGVNTVPSYTTHIAGTPTNTVMLGIIPSSVSSGDAMLFVNAPAVTGLVYLGAINGNASLGTYFSITNNDTTHAGANSILQNIVGGASAGDAYQEFTVNGVTTWQVGLDNSASDKFKIHPGGFTSDDYFTIDTSTGQVGLNKSTPAAHLHVNNTSDIVGFRIDANGTQTTDLLDIYDSTNTLTTSIANSGKITTYSKVATTGWGVPAIYGSGSIGATTNARSATVATYTNGAADGTFEVSGNVNVTTSTTHSFSLDVAYTDESNTPQTLILPMAQLAGAFITGGLITNVTGTGPYEAVVMTIRCKASTSITIRPSAGGTYTGVVYTVSATIKQIA